MSDEWKGFVNIHLTEQDKKEVNGKLLTRVKAFDFLKEMAETGYKVSLTWSLDFETWIVALTGKDGPNKGLTMTQRHAKFETAVTALYYAHVMLTDGDWSKLPSTGNYNW